MTGWPALKGAWCKRLSSRRCSVTPLTRPFAGSKPFRFRTVRYDSPRSTSRPLTLLPGPYLRRRASVAEVKVVVSLNSAQLDAT